MPTQHKLTKEKKRRADYEKKKARFDALPKRSMKRYKLPLVAGRGFLPKSRKFTHKKVTASVQ